MATRHLAFYGRKGVGTTSVVANLGAALAEAGHRVLLVGCGDGDATAQLRGSTAPRPLLAAADASAAALAVAGFKGVLCVETGVAATSAELQAALALVPQLQPVASAPPALVLYDLSGVVPELLTPLLAAAAFDEVLVVGSADTTALHTARSVLGQLAAAQLRARVIGNQLTLPFFEAIVEDFARLHGVPVAGLLPRSLVVTRSAFFGETVVEAAPLAHQAYYYRKLARQLLAAPAVVPRPVEEELLREWLLNWGDRLFDLGEGLVTGGAAI